MPYDAFKNNSVLHTFKVRVSNHNYINNSATQSNKNLVGSLGFDSYIHFVSLVYYGLRSPSYGAYTFLNELT